MNTEDLAGHVAAVLERIEPADGRSPNDGNVLCREAEPTPQVIADLALSSRMARGLIQASRRSRFPSPAFF